MRQEQKELKGLLGGSWDYRKHRSRLPQIDSPYFLHPFLRISDRERLESVLASELLIDLEVGCGRGHFLASYATKHADRFVIGVEVRVKMCKAACHKLEQSSVRNAYVIHGEVQEVSRCFFPCSRFSNIFILYPDPWWKGRHEKRRLLNDRFLVELRRICAPKGVVVFKTDVPFLFETAKKLFLDRYRWLPAGAPDSIPMSHRESKNRQLGLPCYTLCVRKSFDVESNGG